MFFGKKSKPMIDRLKWDPESNDELVYRWPVDNLSWGSQVIVNSSQEAMFYKGGEFLDLLGPGTHTLKTANIPLLQKIVNIPFGDETPFAAEVFYVNKVANLDVKWGTRSPILVEDAQYGVMVPVRAFGQFGIKIVDSKKFVMEIVGSTNDFNVDGLMEYFRGVILTKAKDRIAEVLVKENIPILKVSAYLNEISDALKEQIQPEFDKYGVSIVNFFLNSINFPDDDPSVVRLKELLAERAEFNIMGDDRYRTKRSFDTMEAAATNEGGMSGAMMGAGMGMGMGVGAGGMMAGMMGNQMNTVNTLPSCVQPLQLSISSKGHHLLLGRTTLP